MIKIVRPSRYSIDKKLLIQKLTEKLKRAHIPSEYDVNVILVGTRKMRHLAQSYKHTDKTYPVLAFNYTDNKVSEPNTTHKEMLGEIVICYPQAVLLAFERGKSVDDIILYLTEHGVDNLIK